MMIFQEKLRYLVKFGKVFINTYILFHKIYLKNNVSFFIHYTTDQHINLSYV